VGLEALAKDLLRPSLQETEGPVKPYMPLRISKALKGPKGTPALIITPLVYYMTSAAAAVSLAG
jgi:hypothetical protein